VNWKLGKGDSARATYVAIVVMLLAIIAVRAPQPSVAANPGTTLQKFDYILGEYGSTVVDASTGKIAVTDTDLNSDALFIGGGQNDIATGRYGGRRMLGAIYNSIYIKLNVTDGGGVVDVDLTLEVSRDGSNWKTPSPAITKNITADWENVWNVSLPACKYVRLKCPSDGTDRAYQIEALEAWRY